MRAPAKGVTGKVRGSESHPLRCSCIAIAERPGLTMTRKSNDKPRQNWALI